MSTHKTRPGSVLLRTGLSMALAAAAVGGLASTSFATTTTQQALTLSSVTGPVAGGNTLTMSLASTASPKFASAKVGIQLVEAATAAAATAATCAPAPSTTATTTMTVATTVHFLSTTKVSFAVPPLTNANGSNASLAGVTGYWVVCAYNAAAATGVIPTTATVIGKATYRAFVQSTLVSMSPSTGPAAGGQTVTITGTTGDYPDQASLISATLGGVPLNNLTWVSDSTFTATTTGRANGASVPLQVTTIGGTSTLASAYSYVSGISVSPNTVPQGQSVDVDVQGTGFSTLTFDATSGAADIITGTTAGVAGHTNSTSAHVYLVQGVYNQSGYAPGAPATNKTLGQSTECVDPAVISDTELICTVNAAMKITSVAGVYTYVAGPLPVGTYTVTIVDNGSATGTVNKTVLSSGATFTVADF